LDENGNPIVQPEKTENEGTETPKTTEPKTEKKDKKRSRPTEQQVNFDDL
jgi:hypothetical protein